VLNIGKMDAGPAAGRYYLDSVAGGREDYYTHSGEAPGRWHGAGCGSWGLEGRVSDEPFVALLASVDPISGEQLGKGFRSRTGASAVAGLDLTFRAPKSVSLLFSLGGTYGHQDVSDLVRDAHDRAVEEALGYLNQVAGHARRGQAGCTVTRKDGTTYERPDTIHRIETSGLIHALFRHRTSRAGDPQLHTHAVTINRVLGKDGQWSALDSKAFFGQAKTAGTLYQASLRHHLRELGFKWELGPNGTAEIKGFSRTLLRQFSKRRQEIERAVGERGLSGDNARAAQAATLSTRKAKEYGVDAALLEFGWAQEAAGLGFTVEALDALLEQGRRRLQSLPGDELDRERADASIVAALLLTDEGLTEHASSFSERDVLRELAARMPDGAPADRLMSYARQLLADVEVVKLPQGTRGSLARGDVIRPWSGKQAGRIVPSLGASEARYSTVGLQSVEKRLVRQALDGRGVGAGRASPSDVDAAVGDLAGRGVVLSAEQELMVRRLCLSGDFVSVVNAAAGCGKTTAVSAAARAWEAAGHKVLGVALSAKAAGILRDATGIPCFTVAQLLWELNSDRWSGFAAGTVVVVDEASMFGTRAYGRLADELWRSGGKLVAIGDVHQMPEVDAGGAFRGLFADGRLKSVELVENRRQLDAAERERLLELRSGSVADAMRSYDEDGRVSKCDTVEETRNLLAVDWSVAWLAAGGRAGQAELDRERSLYAMIALTNADVADLNRRARALLHAAGVLSGPELVVADTGRGFQVGDHVVTREISRRSDFRVLNGERWTVTGVDLEEHTVTVRELPSRETEPRTVIVPSWYLERGSLHHGYALTVNISQGSTLRGVHALGSEASYRQAVYTQGSRPTEYAQWYLTRDPEWVDDLCEHQHGQRHAHSGQLPLDLADLGVLVPTEVDPVAEFVRVAGRDRSELMSIDTVSADEPDYLDVPDQRPVQVHASQQDEMLAQEGFEHGR
jgi:conjugative relaxase-like TrwC/TraI family protein